jgi:hypothetical protein
MGYPELSLRNHNQNHGGKNLSSFLDFEVVMQGPGFTEEQVCRVVWCLKTDDAPPVGLPENPVQFPFAVGETFGPRPLGNFGVCVGEQ